MNGSKCVTQWFFIIRIDHPNAFLLNKRICTVNPKRGDSLWTETFALKTLTVIFKCTFLTSLTLMFALSFFLVTYEDILHLCMCVHITPSSNELLITAYCILIYGSLNLFSIGIETGNCTGQRLWYFSFKTWLCFRRMWMYYWQHHPNNPNSLGEAPIVTAEQDANYQQIINPIKMIYLECDGRVTSAWSALCWWYFSHHLWATLLPWPFGTPVKSRWFPPLYSEWLS